MLLSKIKKLCQINLICAFIISFFASQALADKDLPVKVSMIYGGIHKNKMIAFLKIQTPKKYKSYWKVPGFGGVGPEISFDQSNSYENLEILYNPPIISRQNKITNYVFNKEDYIAIAFRPLNPANPTQIKGKMTYGYCDNLCRSATFEFDQTFSVDGPDAPKLVKNFFAQQPISWHPGTKIQINNLVGYYKANKNLLVSFQLKGIDDLDLSKFIYYIDSDFEIKPPLIRKIGSDNYDITLDLYDIYKRPKKLSLLIPNPKGPDHPMIFYNPIIPYKPSR